MKLALFLPNWIGDVVMATPAIRALREHFGTAAQIVGLMRPYVGKVLEGTDWLDENIFFDHRSKDPERQSKNVLTRLRQYSPEMVITFTHSLRAAWLGWRSGARHRIGFARNGCGFFLTQKKRAPKAGRKYVPRSAIDHYLELAEAVGCPEPSSRMELATTATDRSGADTIWDRLNLNGRRVVVCNGGSGSGDTRVWPREYFAALARRMARNLDVSVLFLCGPGKEQDAARDIVTQADDPRVVSMADENLALGVAKACVERADLMISTDSGPRHFAPAFDVPSVAVFGAINWRWSESHHDKAVYLQQPVDCGPCDKHVCPLKHIRCMTELSVDRVFAAAEQQLATWTRTWTKAG